ncbi:hypothetical protein IPM65_04435 [Candidatus Roizmanbacteria bacterium]|nr:MAG: hypothetical protein IPM65_04435 [Candidatus Roizmanbacteria bacterium]
MLTSSPNWSEIAGGKRNTLCHQGKTARQKKVKAPETKGMYFPLKFRSSDAYPEINRGKPRRILFFAQGNPQHLQSYKPHYQRNDNDKYGSKL